MAPKQPAGYDKLVAHIRSRLVGLRDGQSVKLPANFVATRRGKDLEIRDLDHGKPPRVQENVVTDFGGPAVVAGTAMSKTYRTNRKDFEKLHPRDRLGKWRRILGKMKAGEAKAVLGLKVEARKGKLGRREFVVHGGGRESRQFAHLGDAAVDAQERHHIVRAGGAKPIGMEDPGTETVDRYGLRQKLKTSGVALVPGAYESTDVTDKTLPAGAQGDIGGEGIGTAMDTSTHVVADAIISKIGDITDVVSNLLGARMEREDAPDSLSWARARARELALEEAARRECLQRGRVAS